MSYTSLAFIVFLFVTFLIYFLVPKKCRWVILLVSSCIFYGFSAKLLSIAMVAGVGVTYTGGMLIGRQTELFKAQKEGLEKTERKALKAKFDKKKRAILLAAIIIDVGMLLVFKYTGFFITTLNSLAGTGLNAVKFVLPLGISYYTLTSVSYMADVYKGQCKAEKNPLRLLLFISFFPHVVEGPFSRYAGTAPSLFAGESFDYSRFVYGFLRILYGFSKKMIFADRAGIFVNAVFAHETASGGSILLGVIMYTFQIYAEFSGCMDIVLGICEILGVKMTENFRQPFFSKSIDEFWRRWHISLGAWLRDYIFYPLAFSKAAKKAGNAARQRLGEYYGTLLPTVIPLFFVWLTNGFWHGASWKYVVYGLYYFALMMIGKFLKPLTDKFTNKCKINTESKAYGIFAMVRTDIIVLFGMLIFRAPTLTKAFSMAGRVFSDFGGSVTTTEGFCIADAIITAVGFALLFTLGLLLEKGVDIRERLSQHSFIFTWIILLALCILLVIFGKYGAGSGASPFIYGEF